MTYADQIKSPLWQKRRLEILSKDDFTCQVCGEKERTLHVHHIKYKNGCKIWQYKDSELITLCDNFHELEHKIDIDKYINYLSSNDITKIETSLILENISSIIFNNNYKRVLYNLLSSYGNNIENTVLDKLEKRRINWID